MLPAAPDGYTALLGELRELNVNLLLSDAQRELKRKYLLDRGAAQLTQAAEQALVGGDLATAGYPGGDNAINAYDYSALRAAWGTGAAGDINGNGYTDNIDYLIMKANWYKIGNAQ